MPRGTKITKSAASGAKNEATSEAKNGAGKVKISPKSNDMVNKAADNIKNGNSAEKTEAEIRAEKGQYQVIGNDGQVHYYDVDPATLEQRAKTAYKDFKEYKQLTKPSYEELKKMFPDAVKRSEQRGETEKDLKVRLDNMYEYVEKKNPQTDADLRKAIEDANNYSDKKNTAYRAIREPSEEEKEAFADAIGRGSTYLNFPKGTKAKDLEQWKTWTQELNKKYRNEKHSKEVDSDIKDGKFIEFYKTNFPNNYAELKRRRDQKKKYVRTAKIAAGVGAAGAAGSVMYTAGKNEERDKRYRDAYRDYRERKDADIR